MADIRLLSTPEHLYTNLADDPPIAWTAFTVVNGKITNERIVHLAPSGVSTKVGRSVMLS